MAKITVWEADGQVLECDPSTAVRRQLVDAHLTLTWAGDDPNRPIWRAKTDG